MKFSYNLKDVEKMEKIVAQVVIKYGEVYLPIFERIHSEKLKLQKKQTVMDKIRQIANDN